MAAAGALERTESVLRQTQDSQQAAQEAQNKAQAHLAGLVGHLVKLTAANKSTVHVDAAPRETQPRPEKSKGRGAARA
jgi:hypothetical protein